jgi:hypothetical protein
MHFSPFVFSEGLGSPREDPGSESRTLGYPKEDNWSARSKRTLQGMGQASPSRLLKSQKVW